MKIRFTKMSGAGNDFIVLGPQYVILKDRLQELARKMCPRKISVGADGLILVEKARRDIFMHYLNRDGSEALFCGNGARCLVLYCRMKGLVNGTVSFRSGAGTHTGDVTPQGVRVDMKMPVFIRETAVAVDMGDSGRNQYDVYLVDAGVPHAVIVTHGIDSIDVETVGGRIRHHPAFAPEGANADFVDTAGGEPFQLRTYERGVEKETLACGSGCVAAAFVLRLKHLAGDSVRLKVASGDVLTVEFNAKDQSPGSAYLVGPASIVYEGEIDLEELDHV